MKAPQSAPISIRPGDERQSAVAEHAAKLGVSWHAAVLDLIDLGLAKPGTALAVVHRPAASVDRRNPLVLVKRPGPPTDRVKPRIQTDDVPLYSRPVFNPQPKAGGKKKG